MAKISADLCIIGAGSGGLSVAAGAAQLGRSVVLIEKGEMGGDCLNYGCVPSKALLAAAAAAHSARAAADFGVFHGPPDIDFAKVMDHVHGVIAAIAPHDSQERFEGLGVRVVREKGAFIDARTVKAGGFEIAAKHFVIATGSSPATPPIPGLLETPFLTNETLFNNRTRPQHLIVIGGGPIGVEMAQAHQRLGARVTVIEASTILNKDDPEAVDVVRKRLTEEGLAILENCRIAKVEGSTGDVTVTLDSGQRITGSHLLVAAGRIANIADLNLSAAGVEVSNRNIVVDRRLRTSNRRIFAIGDAAGGLQFTHVAGDHASTVIQNILFKMPAKRRDAVAPRVTYCDPELASVGLSASEAQKAHPSARTVRWAFSDNDRARAENDTDGFIKATTATNGAILGAVIVGKGAGDAITLWAGAMANKIGIRAFTKIIAPYPTRSEASKRAGSAFYTEQLFSSRTKLAIKTLATFD